MSVPRWLLRRLFSVALDVASSRSPDVVIGVDRVYLRRWFVIPRNRLANIYLHQVCASDDDRALHDHPWANCSILLDGAYVEHRIAAGGVHSRTRRVAGEMVFRGSRVVHRLELIEGQPCWTLFLTGPSVRSWGFHCPSVTGVISQRLTVVASGRVAARATG